MEEILGRLKSLDNVQLRSELLKHGEKVGPVTPTTRSLFMSRLAKKLYSSQHPGSLDEVKADASLDQPDEKVDNKGRDTAVDASQPDSLASTPTGRKWIVEDWVNKVDMYYVVIPAGSSSTSTSAGADSGPVAEHRVFTEKQDALAFMKKNADSRLKVFQSSADVKRFMTQSEGQGQGTNSKAEGGGGSSSNNLALEAEKSAFKGPKTKELVQFRRLVEKGDVESVKTTVWNNPRYLITGADTPSILHEGMRHNAVHIAARANQPAVVRLVMQTILDPAFTTLLYNTTRDTHQSRCRRILYLSDLYLNSPDKGSAETPLHIACKMGHSDVVQTLVMFSTTDRARINKYGETPEDIICTRYQGDKAASMKQEIEELLKGLCLVPLLRSVDNITLPVVGEPCSPDDKKIPLFPSSTPLPATPSLPVPFSPREPRLTLSAYAGPMSPSKARNFQKQWMNPRCSKNTYDVKEFTIARRTDAEKGYERIGRKLARDLHVQWSEYWQFLDAFADFSTQEGLVKLEQHLSRQRLQLAVLSAMEGTASSDEDSAGCSSTDSSFGEESQDDCFYSCNEASEDEDGRDNSNVSNSRVVELACDDDGDDDDDKDVFEDSLDSFFDSQSYVFGQRLQLKKSMNSNNNNGALPKDETKAYIESAVDASTVQKKQSGENSDHWSYRDTIYSGEEEKRPSETSYASDTSAQSLDASKSFSGEKVHEDKQKRPPEAKIPVAPKTPGEVLDKSFNTVMTELSDDLETKLIFSPDGKVISKKRCLVPDVGLCLERNVASTLRPARRGHCPLDILIKSRKGSRTFLADVLVHTSYTGDGEDDFSSDDSSDSFPHTNSRQKFLRDVKLVTRNTMVLQYMRRLWRPTRLTVGLLETGTLDVAQHCGCITARIVRQKPGRHRPTSCYIYGSTASKTDLDVMRAMCDVDVDPTVLPAVCSWLSLVTGTEQERRNSWPSPAKLRHQHRLSVLQKSVQASSPLPISPLVEGGTVTSTPVSRSSHHAERSSRRHLSLDPPDAQGTPRAWLFKSPI